MSSKSAESACNALNELDSLIGDEEKIVRLDSNQFIEKYYKNPDAVSMFAEIFSLNKDAVASAFSKTDILENDYYSKGRMFDMGPFVKGLSILIESRVLTKANIPDKIVWKMKYSNREKADEYVTIFRIGTKLSDVDLPIVNGVGDQALIMSKATGAVRLIAANSCVLVCNVSELQVDEFKIFYGCTLKEYRLKDLKWEQTIHLKDGDTLYIDGDVEIEADCPIDAYGAITFKAVNPGAKLHLKATERRQPCIGAKTATNLSYGRWSLAYGKCEKIIVDGVRVECESATSHFMLGEYGTNNVPAITCINGGALNAIETWGLRKMVVVQEKPVGSTKYDTDPEYILA